MNLADPADPAPAAPGPGQRWHTWRIARTALAGAALGAAALVGACRQGISPGAAGGPVGSPVGTAAAETRAGAQVDAARPGAAFSGIADAVLGEIAAGHTPGAVILVGQRGKAVFRQAFGNQMLEPQQPMTVGTVFDLASLTKVVATAPAILQLADQGRLRLDDPVAQHWPEFGRNGKAAITLRQLLTHFSGLRIGMDDSQPWSGRDGALQVIADGRPVAQPGSRFSYSDVDFIVLGEVVRRVSGLDLDAYAARHIFAPLGMRDTGFNPGPGLRDRIAPSDVVQGQLRWGQVQDPIAWRMGGVAGHAGLFSTADDLALFATMIGNGGVAGSTRILSPGAVRAMTSPQGPPSSPVLRGLGWDIRSAYSDDFSPWFSGTSFGHTGYTGTSLWIDPALQGFEIILTNRLHPDGRGQVRALRSRVSQLAAAALARSVTQVRGNGAALVLAAALVPVPVLDASPRSTIPVNAPIETSVKTGIDVLEGTGFARLAGLRVGLITNQTGLDLRGRRTADVLAGAPGVRLVRLFSPEHGLSGTLDERVASSTDAATGLAVFSLYGDVRRPTADALAGLDALVFDIQDAGARYYTYITTLAYAMEAAAKSGIKVFVLDRPNPLNAETVQGPVMEAGLRSFAGYFPLPTRHGMTVGEIALLYNRDAGIGADLQVVAMEGYRRRQWFDQTGHPWVNPSPNLRSLTEALLYAGVGMLEGTNVSVGRGTATPFEVLGAPWMDGPGLAGYLATRRIPGVRIRAASFTPTSGPYRGEPCQGVRFEVSDRDLLDPPRLGIELISAVWRLHRGAFQADRAAGMVGSRAVLQGIVEGSDPAAVRMAWQPELDRFLSRRKDHLLYR